MDARRERLNVAHPKGWRSGRVTKRARAVALVVAAALVASSCAAFTERDDTSVSLDDVERANRAEGDVEGRLGDTLEVYSLEATVTEVERVASFSEIDSRGYIVASVSMHNPTGESIDYDRSDWKIEKPDDAISNTANVSTEPQLQDDTIPAGGTIEGRVIFTVGDMEGQFAILFIAAALRPEDQLSHERGVWVFESAPGDAG